MVDSRLVAGSIWFYTPNQGAPIFFAVAFALSGCLHLWQCIRYKCFKVTFFHPMACFMFAVGFVFREYGAYHDGNVAVFITSTILVYISPPLLELANYHALGRILYYVPYFSPIHPGRTLTTFGLLNINVETLNGLGVSWVASPNVSKSIRNIGSALLKASLLIQIAVILLFVLLVGIVYHRCAKRGGQGHKRRVSGQFLTMYISSVLILVRCIYRTVELFSKSEVQYDGVSLRISPLAQHEWLFYLFEATIMLSNEIAWNVRHPMRSLPRDCHIYLDVRGEREFKGPGWEDNRSFLATVIDPFGLCKVGCRKKPRFWETEEFGRADDASISI